MKRSMKLTTAIAGLTATGAIGVLGIALAGPALADPSPSPSS